MKRIKKSDLIHVLNNIPGDKDLDIRDLMDLFDAFGDDWVIMDGKGVKAKENEAMEAMRKTRFIF